MSETWLKTLALILVFAAVVFAVERFVSAIVGRRMEGQAINQRLEMIGRGASRSEAMAMLRRRSSSVPEGLPAFVAGPAASLEKMLMAAGVTMETGRLIFSRCRIPTHPWRRSVGSTEVSVRCCVETEGEISPRFPSRKAAWLFLETRKPSWRWISITTAGLIFS